ncbi:MAG: FAD-dependent oxidoreductase [Gammaproteobacteria bacterium]|nr:FAD-dependent oxidoreductase [Gammaproteobacteria bacterium]
MQKILVIGAGHGAGQLLDSLRRGGCEDSITLLGEESWLPYQRPPLSKKFLSDELSQERLAFRPGNFYTRNQIDTRLSCRVVSLDRNTASVELDTGEWLPFDRLAIATGARVRVLPVPGAALGGLHYLRDIDDARGLREDWADRQEVCVIGGGFIGLEVAASARALGKNVTVVEALDRLMARAVSPAMSDFFLKTHVAHGTRVLLNAAVEEVLGDNGRVCALRLADGRELPVDVVVVGIGVLPNQELAADAGLDCDNGVVVDEFAQTSDPRIVAFGDCSNHPNTLLGRRLRLESVHNAVEQARTAAASLMGQKLAYNQVPWFWSDQFECKLQMVGLSEGCDRVVQRGSPEAGKFSLFCFRDEELLAVESLNSAADHMVGRKLLAARVYPSYQQAADQDFALKTLLQPWH